MKAIEFLSLIKDEALRNKALKAAKDFPTVHPEVCVYDIRSAILHGFHWGKQKSEEWKFWNNLYDNPPELISKIDVFYQKMLSVCEEAKSKLDSDSYQFFLEDIHQIYMKNFSQNPQNPVFGVYDLRIKEYFKIFQNQSKALEGLKAFSKKMKRLCLQMAYDRILEEILEETGINQSTCSAEDLVKSMRLVDEKLKIFKKENI